MPLRTRDGGPDHSEAEIMILLSNRIRRRTIEILRASEGDLRVAHVADRIAAANGEPRQGDSLRAALSDVQLPRLATAGVIDFDETEGTVRRGPNFDRFVAVIDSVTHDDLPWVES